MPNNSNARQKKKDKKKTVPPPLHKEDKASVDSISLSLAGKDKASVDSTFLSLAGKDKVSMDSSSLSLSLAGKDKASEDISLFSSLAEKDSEKVVPSSGVKVMTAQERMAYSFSLSCRLSASAQPKDSPNKDSEISLLSDTGWRQT